MDQSEQEQYEHERRRYMPPTQYPESSLTIKWWALIVVVLSIFGFFFLTILTHESRLTKIETIAALSLSKIERDVTDLKSTLERHDRAERRPEK